MIGGNVENRFSGPLPGQPDLDYTINTQANSQIFGNVRNELDQRSPDQDAPTTATAARKSIGFFWKNLPPLNALLQVLDRALRHLFGS